MPSFTIDYLPVATAAGANVDSQATFAGSGYQTMGFQNGLAIPSQINKALRQGSMIAAMLATFISNQLSISIFDDGDLTGLLTNLTKAISTLAKASASSVAPPTPTTVAGLGDWASVLIASGASGTVSLPSGGTWAYFFMNNSYGYVGIAAGGTSFSAASLLTGTVYNCGGFCWRIV